MRIEDHIAIPKTVDGYVSPKDYFVRSAVQPTYVEVARKFGISPPTVSEMSMAEGWQTARRAHFTALERAASDAHIRKNAGAVEEMNSRHIGAWKSVAGIALSKITRQIQDARKRNPSSDGLEGVAYSDLEKVSRILLRAQAGERLALGLLPNESASSVEAVNVTPQQGMLTILQDGDPETLDAIRAASRAVFHARNPQNGNGHKEPAAIGDGKETE